MRENEQNIFYFKMTIVIGLVLLAWALFSYSKLLYRSYQLDLKKEWFTQENERLVQENHNLADEFEYLQSASFLEREAKEKLNKKKPGENVIVLRDPPPKFATFIDEKESLRLKLESLTNAQKWWYYFFGTEEMLENL